MGTVLLDLDGTLVDSGPLIVDHLELAFAAVGLPVPPRHELWAFVGPPLEDVAPGLGLAGERARTFIEAYRASYPPVAPSSPPFPQAARVLDGLRAAGFTLALATSKQEWLAREMVERNGFDVDLVGGADPPARVGKARVIASVLERLGLDPARDPVVMVGDRVHDVEGAAEHGIPTLGVAWGYAAPGELAGAAGIAADPEELLDALRPDGAWSVPRDAGLCEDRRRS
ncbi:MAG: HAD hydrolase-like protein [Pseudonocardia sp.]